MQGEQNGAAYHGGEHLQAPPDIPHPNSSLVEALHAPVPVCPASCPPPAFASCFLPHVPLPRARACVPSPHTAAGATQLQMDEQGNIQQVWPTPNPSLASAPAPSSPARGRRRRRAAVAQKRSRAALQRPAP